MVAGGIAAAGSVASGAIKAHAAGEAADVQASAAEKAQQLIAAQQKDALDAQKKALADTTAAEQPYQQVGRTSANNLVNLLNNPFKPPSLQDVENSPGFQFRLNTGIDALDKSASARGNLFSGTQGTALQNYGQGLATTQYAQDYQQALDAYQANYQDALGGATLGLNSTGQLASANQNSASNTANIDLTGANMQASQINNAAAARASGYVGSANAWAPAVQSVANFASLIPGKTSPYPGGTTAPVYGGS